MEVVPIRQSLSVQCHDQGGVHSQLRILSSCVSVQHLLQVFASEPTQVWTNRWSCSSSLHRHTCYFLNTVVAVLTKRYRRKGILFFYALNKQGFSITN